MPRSLTAGFNTNVEKTITRPVWLVKLGYSIPLLCTSGGAVTIGAETFSRQGLRVSSMSDTALKFTLRDNDNAVKALIDAEGIDDIAVTAWKHYEGEEAEVWSGFTDGVRFRNHEAEFQAERIRQIAASFPERFYNRNDFPYLPSDGTVIKWAGVEITLRSR